VTRMGEMRCVLNILVVTSEGKRPLGRSRYGWEDNNRMDLTETAWKFVDWILLA